MVNVGLRAFLWDRKAREEKVKRELWSMNGATYVTYRDYISYCKDDGFPEQRASRAPSRRATIDSAAPEQSEVSFTSSAGTQSNINPFVFAGMRHIFDDGKSPITVVSFGRLDSSWLAYGSMDGVVRVARMDEPPRILHTLSLHKRPVTDLDWAAENAFLLTCCDDGSVCLWEPLSGALVRPFLTASPALCCRFHPSNQNLLLVGTANGDVEVFNSSTGKVVARHALSALGYPEGVAACAMDASPTMLVVGDSKANLHCLRCEIKAGALQPISMLSRTPSPDGRQHAIASVAYSPYTALTQSPAVLTATLDSTICVFKVQDGQVGRLAVASTARLPPIARRIRASFCPMLNVDTPEYVAMGGEDTCVYVYDMPHGHASRRTSADTTQRGAQVVNKLQGHMAPVVDVSWSYDESMLASGDCDGVLIVWRRDKADEMKLNAFRL